jgi:hypothetical protein
MRERGSSRNARRELAAALAAPQSVLFTPLLGDLLWPWLDRSSKVALRGVCRDMRREVAASIKDVTSPASGFSADTLKAVLEASPVVRYLFLHMVGAPALEPLATATMPGLQSLSVREVGSAHGCTDVRGSSCMAIANPLAHGLRTHGWPCRPNSLAALALKQMPIS